MHKEDVLIQFEKLSNPSPALADMPGIGIFLGIYVLLFITVVIMRMTKAKEGYGWIAFGYILSICVHLVLSKGYYQEKVEKGIEQWKQEYAIPYINSLPKEKHEIVFMKIEANSSQKIKDNGLWLASQEVQRTPMTISFKGNTGIETQTYWYATDMSLTPEQKPYIEYTVLPEDIGIDEQGNAGFWAGRYNHKIYLPENYEFKDIK